MDMVSSSTMVLKYYEDTYVAADDADVAPAPQPRGSGADGEGKRSGVDDGDDHKYDLVSQLTSVWLYKGVLRAAATVAPSPTQL